MTNIETTHLTENAVDYNKVANNSINKSKPPDDEALYFVDLAEKWLRSEKLKTKESTFVQYNLILRNHIYPLLGKDLVVDIDRQTIEQTVIYYLSNGRLDGGGGLATKTTSDILMVIKSIFDYANQTGILSSSPTKGVCVKKRTKELCVLSLSEERALLLHLFNNTDLYKLGVLICLYTGIRIGELCALKWKNVCIDQRVIKIQHTMQRISNLDLPTNEKTRIIVTEPKSQSSIREIPIPSQLLSTLKLYATVPEAYVLSGKIDQYIEPRTMQYRFKSYLKTLGLPNTNFHSLRHTFATRCVESGIDIKCLSEILGHATVNITLNRYVHSSFDMKQKCIERIANFYDCSMLGES